MSAPPIPAPPIPCESFAVDGTDRRIARLIALLALAIYLLTASGTVFNSDGAGRLELALSVMDRGAIDVTHGYAGRDGKTYSPWGLGQPLIAIPLLAAARRAGAMVPGFPPDELERAAYSVINQLVTALTLGLLYLYARRCGCGRRPAALAALGYGFLTFAWQQSKDSFEHPLIAGLLVGALLLLIGERHLLASGVCAGLALIVRPDALVIVAWIFVLVCCHAGDPRRILAWTAPVILGGAAVLAYNHARFGSPFDFGLSAIAGTPVPLTPWTVPARLLGLTVLPYRGLLFFAPASVLCVLGWPALHARRPHLAKVLAAAAGSHLFGLTLISQWSGAWCWGPRHLTAALAILVPAAAFALARTCASRNGRLFLVALTAVSLPIQLASVSVNYLRSYYLEELHHSVKPDPLFPGGHLCGQTLIASQLATVRCAIGTAGMAWRGELPRRVPDSQLERRVNLDASLATWHVWWWHWCARGHGAPFAIAAALVLALAGALCARRLVRELEAAR